MHNSSVAARGGAAFSSAGHQAAAASGAAAAQAAHQHQQHQQHQHQHQQHRAVLHQQAAAEQMDAGPGPSSLAALSNQGAGTTSFHMHQRPKQLLQQHQQEHYKTAKLLLSGALAGAVSRTVTAPIDRLKMIMQVHERSMTVRQGIERMASEGGWRGFFRGNGANVIKIAPETAMKLTLNDAFKLHFARDPEHLTASERMVAGGVAGAIAQFITYPLDTIRTRLTVSAPGVYDGIFHVAYLMRRDEGFKAFYRGLTPSMLGILPYAGVDICLFEMFKAELLDRAEQQGGPPPNLSLLVAGMVSSSIAQVVSYPLALIRTRLQAQRACTPGAPMGMADVLRKTIANEGVLGLYKGLLPNIFKLAPAAGVGWWIFEESKRHLGLDPRV